MVIQISVYNLCLEAQNISSWFVTYLVIRVSVSNKRIFIFDSTLCLESDQSRDSSSNLFRHQRAGTIISLFARIYTQFFPDNPFFYHLCPSILNEFSVHILKKKNRTQQNDKKHKLIENQTPFPLSTIMQKNILKWLPERVQHTHGMPEYL